MMQCKLYARGGGGGSQEREVADGADVVFTATVRRLQTKSKISSEYVFELQYARRCPAKSHS